MNIIIEAYNKGYRVIEGNLYNPKSILIKGSTIDGYLSTRITKHGKNLFFHRLLAYQKYGDDLFKEGIEVRHLDGNPLNNSVDNITIGTHSDNMMDIPKDKRIKRSSNRKYDYDIIRQYYHHTRSYKRTMEHFGITSKGTLNYIIRGSSMAVASGC